LNSISIADSETRAHECASDQTQIRSKAPRRRVCVEALEYHSFKARTSNHPLFCSAYDLWRDEWRATFQELDGTTRISSDEFLRQDEISVVSVGSQCIAVTGLRWLNLSLAVAREDSYFMPWPEEAMRQLGSSVVGISGNTTIQSDWRGSLIEPALPIAEETTPLALATMALTLRRFVHSPAENVIAVARNDRSMNRVAASIGATTIGQIKLHGIDSDLILISRGSASTRGAVVDWLWARRHQE
jgi:hypothetical protein